MLEHDAVACPFCSQEISVRTITVGKKLVYVVDKDCNNCGSRAERIEGELNRSNRKSKFNVERSYIKLGPRG